MGVLGMLGQGSPPAQGLQCGGKPSLTGTGHGIGDIWGEVLELVGLDEEEERVYLALLELGAADVRRLLSDGAGPAAQAGSGEGAADLALEKVLMRLEERGLVEVVVGEPARYRLIDPALALAEVLAAREHDLQRSRLLVDQIAARHRERATAGHGAPLVEVVDDQAVAAQTVLDVYGRAEHEVLAMERPPYGEPNREPNPIELDLLSRGVGHRVLYEHSAVDQPGRLADLVGGLAAGECARVLPRLPARLMVVDHRCAMLPARTGGLLTESLLVLREGALLDVVVELFEMTWRRAIPLRVDERDAVGPDGPNRDDRILLALMASGLTDQAIARHLGISERTVQRRIQRLCERLGAGTRFQAGLQAARERWL